MDDVIRQIKEQIDANRIILFMKGTPDFPQCGFSARAVAALKACGSEFAFVNIFEYPEVRERLKEYSNWPTFPQLFVDGELLGGSDIIIEMYESGELEPMLKAPAEA